MTFWDSSSITKEAKSLKMEVILFAKCCAKIKKKVAAGCCSIWTKPEQLCADIMMAPERLIQAVVAVWRLD